MTIYSVETWSPGPPAGAWRELASTRDRAAAIAAMTAYAVSHVDHYRPQPPAWGRLRVVARP